MNRRYYGARVAKWHTRGRLLGLTVAIGSTTSTVGAWPLWHLDTVGPILWAIISGVASVAAIVQTVVAPNKLLERYSALFAGYSVLTFDLSRIADDLRANGQWTADTTEQHARALERLRELAKDDDPRIDDALRERCFAETNTAIAVANLWWPPNPGGTANAP
jgi:hypothetical protein